jgi:hypothetical protein
MLERLLARPEGGSEGPGAYFQYVRRSERLRAELVAFSGSVLE